jgi:hypothetical protein
MFDTKTTLRIFNGNVIGTVDAFPKLWCVYQHIINSPSGNMPVYVGICRLHDVFEFPDARRNSSWLEIIGRSGLAFEIKIIATSEHKFECFRHANDLVRSSQPYCNVNGMQIGNSKTSVTCNETGETFATASRCAAAEGISASALSKHLNGQAGWATVKGKTYRRGV